MANWTDQEIKQLKEEYDRCIDQGLSGWPLAEAIGKAIGRTRDGAKYGLRAHFKLSLKNPKFKTRRGSCGYSLKEGLDKPNIQMNIDTITHPYYRAASILNTKPGVSAKVGEDGICYRNGFPWPAVKFMEEAGIVLEAAE